LAYSLRVSPDTHFINWQQDPFGNYEARLVFTERTNKISFDVDLVADLTTINPFDFFLEKDAERFGFSYSPLLSRDLGPYLERMASTPLFSAFVEDLRRRFCHRERRVIDVLVDINQAVQSKLTYELRMDPGVFAPERTLELGRGSCRDFAWLLVQVLRHIGLAARFASGYSVQLKADERPLEGSPGVLEDVVDLHAWTEVFLPGAGWVGLDATSGLLVGEGHIPLACTPDPETAAPITGSYSWEKREPDEKIREDFSFEMSVRRLLETPRTTLPYSDAVWHSIDSLGQRVDDVLSESDVRLTMGGEPTFVAAGDPDAGEWNFDALGPTKRGRARELLGRLKERFAPHGLIHEGIGKWYPGEPLPRWILSCYFRRDGEPIWNHAALLSRDSRGVDTVDDAAAFAKALAERLGVHKGHIVPAYEDAWYYLWRERKLPANVDPYNSRLDDELERARIAKVFEQGLGTIVGYALPLRRSQMASERPWESGPWVIRAERLVLLAGDSPMGLRLPLDSLLWSSESDKPALETPDPMAPRDPLPTQEERRARQMHRLGSPEPSTPRDAVASTSPQINASASGVIRTALCVEPRDGILHIFFPPLGHIEDFLELASHVEATAAALGKSVRLEGYAPPPDPRVERLSITPDPGVIEVNIHPSASWAKLVSNTNILYEEARRANLRAEKFMLDGRHTGTGGGDHIVLGGPTAADSPLLRRPDLLRSLVGYWLNHPSLSYLFSGLFVGPTSQAPRVDEARHDSLYELEIAFRLLGGVGEPSAAPPWLVDRLFRHLLVDVTGNTHRTQFCIDKLFSPDHASGRQGLLELRSFEMPPHPRMSLASHLLVRALVAWFWREPYRLPPVRWGTELHDRFALPHFVWSDFEDVIADLTRAGFDFDPSWFLPHFEFRFPLLGSLEARAGVSLELRQAIEPWHVLGEEASGGGSSRYVDSSVERIEVLARGLIGDRHVVACNGRRVPLRPTGTNGERVAGVRFKAWKPPSALHPTIGVHAPLVFDVIDQWNAKAIAGCTYHVANPGGLAVSQLPQTALEAESRRASRFWGFGHTPGPVVPPPRETNEEFPFTLDLRRVP